MPETASKLLNLGVPLERVVQQSTAAAADAIGRSEELGTLREGTVADLAAFEVLEGTFEFQDVRGRREQGDRKIEPVLTVRRGKAHWPEDLREELEEARERARFMRSLTGRNFAALGWVPGG